MNRRRFLSTAAASAAALAVPFQAKAIAPAVEAPRPKLKCLAMRTFISEWNKPFSPGSGRRIDVEVKRLNGPWDHSEAAAFRFIDWAVTEWAPSWIEHGCRASAARGERWHCLEDQAGYLRKRTIASYRDILEVSATIISLRDFALEEDDEAYERMRQLRFKETGYLSQPITAAVYDALWQSGWNAACEGADDCVIDSVTDSMLDLVWDIVEETVAAGGSQDVDGQVVALRASAIAMLEELNAE